MRLDPDESPFLDVSRCYDCRLCIPACPFEAISIAGWIQKVQLRSCSQDMSTIWKEYPINIASYCLDQNLSPINSANRMIGANEIQADHPHPNNTISNPTSPWVTNIKTKKRRIINVSSSLLFPISFTRLSSKTQIKNRGQNSVQKEKPSVVELNVIVFVVKGMKPL